MSYRTYKEFLYAQDIDTLEAYLDDAHTELAYCRDSDADEDEIEEALEHVRDIRSVINAKY